MVVKDLNITEEEMLRELMENVDQALRQYEPPRVEDGWFTLYQRMAITGKTLDQTRDEMELLVKEKLAEKKPHGHYSYYRMKKPDQ